MSSHRKTVVVATMRPHVSQHVAATQTEPAAPALSKIATFNRNTSDSAMLDVTLVATRVENEISYSVRNNELFELSKASMTWSVQLSCDADSQLHLRCVRQNNLLVNQWKLDYDICVRFSLQEDHADPPLCPELALSGSCTAANGTAIEIPIEYEIWKPLIALPSEEEISVETDVWAELDFTFRKISGFRSLSRFSYDFTQASRDSDAVFKFGKENVFVNCSFLSFHSEYFSATKDHLSDVQTKHDSNGLPIVEVEGVDPDGFIKLMQIVYPSKHEITDANIGHVLVLADRFGFEAVLEDCEKFLWSGESDIDLTTYLHWSTQYDMKALQEWCFGQFTTREDFDGMMWSDAYSQLTADVTRILMQKLHQITME